MLGAVWGLVDDGQMSFRHMWSYQNRPTYFAQILSSGIRKMAVQSSICSLPIWSCLVTETRSSSLFFSLQMGSNPSQYHIQMSKCEDVDR